MEPERPDRGTIILLVAAVIFVAVVGLIILALRETASPIVEAQGKRNAAATDAGRALSARFGQELRFLALEKHRVDDHDLIGEIFPEFPRGKIGCVIVARVGDEGTVFVEDQRLRVIHEESFAAFQDRTRNVDRFVVSAFYASLA